ncbi:MAG TPA: hypothetical protein VHD87_17395, partial [Acidimicrobiales bacterium]|nr:hypothetical protein [Acidimicrobiales bacterium]
GGALPAQAKSVIGVPVPPKPTATSVEKTVKSMIPPKPAIVVPSAPNPHNLQLPVLPVVFVPNGLRPALGVLGPTGVVTCQVSYLGPLGLIVVMSKAMDTLGQHPFVPSLFSPLFSPVTTVCTAAPYPTVSSCGPDGTITHTLAKHPDLPTVPGGLPTVDPFATIPAPFASLVVEVGAVQTDVQHYVYNDTVKLTLQKKVEKQLECK